MYEKTLRTIAASKLPSFIFTEKTQVGKTFAKRLNHAITKVFEDGYENVIIVGSDTPSLEIQDIITTNKIVSTGQNTFGKTNSGGAYIIGISKQLFHESTFCKLPWKTNKLANALVMQLQFTFSQLAVKSDLNTSVDFKAALRKNTLLKFWLIEIALYFKQYTKQRFTETLIQQILSSGWSVFKAPPNPITV